MYQVNAWRNTCIPQYLRMKVLFIFPCWGGNSPRPPSLCLVLVNSFPSSSVHYCRGSEDLTISWVFHPCALVTGRAGKESQHYIRVSLTSTLQGREPNMQQEQHCRHWAGLSPLLHGIIFIKDSLFLCSLKFGRPWLSEILQALALSPCLYLAQTY